MQLTVKSRNLELTDALRTYAEKKLAKLEKQLHPTTQVELELAVEKNPSISANQVAEATVWLKGPHTLRVREASPDMKASIDELSRHLLRQIKDERERRRSKSKRAAAAAVPLE